MTADRHPCESGGACPHRAGGGSCGETGHCDGGAGREPWRSQFPYHWHSDDLVSRREVLRFAVMASGALFAVTGGLAVAGLLPARHAHARALVASKDRVPEGAAIYFRYPGPADEAVLLHLPGRKFVAYSQRCTHLSCSVYYQGERDRLYCPCHEGAFSPLTGDPIAGPPRRPLARVLLEEDERSVFAVGVAP